MSSSTTTMPAKKAQPAKKSYSLAKSNPNLKVVVIPALALTFGFSLKSVVDSTVFDLIEPLAFKLLYLTELNRVGALKNIVSSTNRGFRISHWLSSVLSFIFVIYIVLILLNYYI